MRGVPINNHAEGLCCKTHEMYRYKYDKLPEVPWLLHIIDDTFVHLENMLDFLTENDERFQREPKGLVIGDADSKYKKNRPRCDMLMGVTGWLINHKAQDLYGSARVPHHDFVCLDPISGAA